MLPARGLNNLTLQFPDEVEIYLMGSLSKHMYHFKTAVIKTMTTNFAPDGVLSFFGKSGAPTAVTIDLQLQETTIHTREDYDGSKMRYRAMGDVGYGADTEGGSDFQNLSQTGKKGFGQT